MKRKLWFIVLLSQIILSCNKELITEQPPVAAGTANAVNNSANPT
jgi:hypothetical protein